MMSLEQATVLNAALNTPNLSEMDKREKKKDALSVTKKEV